MEVTLRGTRYEIDPTGNVYRIHDGLYEDVDDNVEPLSEMYNRSTIEEVKSLAGLNEV